MVTGIVVNSEIEFDQDNQLSSSAPAVAKADGSRPASNGGDQGGWAFGAAQFHAEQISDKWGWGVSLVSISAAVLDPDDHDDFAGRYWATEVEMITITAMPSVSYKLTDDFSVGLGVPVMYALLDMDVVVPGPSAGAPEGKAKIQDGDDLVVGFNLSTLWQVTDGLNLGLQYVSELELDFDSDLSLTPPPGVSEGTVKSAVKFTFPQTLRASLTQASDRTTDQPIDEQWRFSGGLTYERDNGHKIGTVLTYADYGDGAISNGGSRPGGDPWTVNGDYSSNRLLFLGLNYAW